MSSFRSPQFSISNQEQILVTYSRPFWRELGMSGSAMSHGGGPIMQLYDSCGPDDRGEGPHALCGFVYGSGPSDSPPEDATLRRQVCGALGWVSL